MDIAGIIFAAVAIAGLLAVIVLLVILILDLLRERRVIGDLLSAAGSGTYSGEMVASLPEPVQRYFNHAIAEGTPLAAGVVLEMKGEIRPDQDQGWWEFTGYMVSGPQRGFLWTAFARKGLLRLSGGDMWHGGQGRMRWNMLGIIPVVRAGGTDVSRSAVGRLAGELTWVPSLLLPRPGVTWKAVSDNIITVLLDLHGESFALTLLLADSGAVAQLRYNRWGPADGKEYGELVFGMNCEQEVTAQGYTVPGKIEVGWRPDDSERRNMFFKTQLVKAKYF